MDPKTFQDLETRSKDIADRAAGILERARALLDRTGDVEVATLAALDRLGEGASVNGLSAHAIAELVEVGVTERLAATQSKIDKLQAALAELPERVSDAGSPDRVNAITAKLQEFRAQIVAAGNELQAYVADTMVDEVFAPQLQRISTSAESVAERADEGATSIAEAFDAWGERLVDAAAAIDARQTEWLDFFTSSWEERASRFSDHVLGRYEQLEAQAEALLAKLSGVIDSVGETMETVAALRQGLGEMTESTGGGLSTVVEIIDDVRAIFEAVD